ncbi:DUF4124 domain-containing protein [Geobacter sp. FeAm09]|uniref:DUF4124 domain-containing protein n=1 Tax=Geobacter sp. FeAm09 TaxID=2597769 RepID=UPI00143D145A|nr:DUF4124 domain-containing protein [Geobacter sp. FeAm09]
MKIVAMAAIALCCAAAGGNAATYRWTDDQGVLNFTDSLETVPAKYRHRVLKGPDITTRDPRISEEVKQQEERARQEQAAQPPVATTPDYMPAQPPEAAPAKVESDELPPGRTRSQKIRDNMERRKAEEEKAQQSGSQQ